MAQAGVTISSLVTRRNVDAIFLGSPVDRNCRELYKPTGFNISITYSHLPAWSQSRSRSSTLTMCGGELIFKAVTFASRGDFLFLISFKYSGHDRVQPLDFLAPRVRIAEHPRHTAYGVHNDRQQIHLYDGEPRRPGVPCSYFNHSGLRAGGYISRSAEQVPHPVPGQKSSPN